nr:ARID DNA-binding domain-containing protein [Tanacetum cinerariifolium]
MLLIILAFTMEQTLDDSWYKRDLKARPRNSAEVCQLWKRGHVMKNCPMKEHDQEKQETRNTSETAKEINKGEIVVKNGNQWYLIPGVHYAPEVTLNILSIELLESQGIEIIYEGNTCRLIYVFSNPKDHKLDEDKLRTIQNEYLEKYFKSLSTGNERMKSVGFGDDQIEIKGTTFSTKVNTFNEYVAFLNLLKQDEIISQEWDAFRNKFDRVVKWFYERYLERPLPGPMPPKINGVTIHLMDLYKLVESFGGYLSVYFAREFGKIGEILGLSLQDGEEIRRCYINFLDVFTSYYKTARVSKQEHDIVLGMPTNNVEKGKKLTCPTFHQCDFDDQAPNKETASTKGKEKIKHFGIILEDERKDVDSHQIQPISPNIKRSQTKDKNLQGMIKTSKNSVKEDTNSNSSASALKEHRQLLRLMQFLMGLDDVYGLVRSQILNTKPLPDVKSAFATLSRDESHKTSYNSHNSNKTSPTAYATKSNDWNANKMKLITLICEKYGSGSVHANVAVPDYHVSLLSVPKLSKDNKLRVIFDGSQCLI